MRFFAFITLFILPVAFIGQKMTEEEKVLSHVHAIFNNGGWFVEVEGYQLFVEDFNGGFNESTIKKVKKKYRFDKELESIVNPNLYTPHELFVADIPTDSDTTLRAVYVVQFSDARVKVFDFVRSFKRDNFVELVIIKAFLEDRLPASAYTLNAPINLTIVDTTIPLGAQGVWMKPHSIHLGEGQMNWGEFRNRHDAEMMVRSYYRSLNQRHLIEVISQDSVHLSFLGHDDVGLQLKAKVKLPSLVMGGCKFLDVYYVVAKVGDTYVGAVLSQYSCFLVNQEFVPLLDKMLWLKED